MSLRKNTFRTNQRLLKEEMDKERHLSNRLNKWNDIKESIKEKAYAEIREDYPEDKIEESLTHTNIVMHLCEHNKIDLWRPKLADGSFTTDAKKCLLGKKDIERLDNGKGISMHRLYLIAYGVGKKALKMEGINRANIATVTDQQWLKLANEYHKEKELARKARKAKKVETSDSLIVEHEEVGEKTVDSILNGETSLKEVENIELLKESYQLANSAGKKGAITRRLNQLEA